MRNSALIVLLFSTLTACGDQGITEADKREERTLQVVGMVTDCTDGLPLPRARIRVYEWALSGEATLVRSETDDNGRYMVSFSDRKLCDSAPRGSESVRFEVEASCPGYHTGGVGPFSDTSGVRCVERTQQLDFCLHRLEQAP